jgi:hypothetical protein
LVPRRAHPYPYANFSDGGAGGFFGRHLSAQNKYMAVSFLYEPPALASGASAQLVTLRYADGAISTRLETKTFVLIFIHQHHNR